MLLAEYAVLGPLRLDAPEEGALDGAIGVGDRRQVGLRLDAQVERAEARKRDRVGEVGQLEREGQIRVHACTYGLLDDLEDRLRDDELDPDPTRPSAGRRRHHQVDPRTR